MSAILEAVLDDERRAECRANDGAMAMGRPIIANQPTAHPVRPTSSLHRSINGVITPMRIECSNAARVATNELR